MLQPNPIQHHCNTRHSIHPSDELPVKWMNPCWLQVFDSAFSDIKPHTVRHQVKTKSIFSLSPFTQRWRGCKEQLHRFSFTPTVQNRGIFMSWEWLDEKSGEWVPASITQLLKTNKSKPCPNPAGQGSPYQPRDSERERGLLHFHSFW